MNKRIFLVLEDFNETNKQLPKGYSIRQYQAKDKLRWLKLIVEQGVLETPEVAIQSFQDVYEQDLEWTNQWLYCVVDSSDIAVSFCSISKGNHTPSMTYRLHFVATDNKHLRKGLSEVLISRILNDFLQEYPFEKIYVVTQPIFDKAIVLYQKLGFVPKILESTLVSKAQQQDYWSLVGINL